MAQSGSHFENTGQFGRNDDDYFIDQDYINSVYSISGDGSGNRYLDGSSFTQDGYIRKRKKHRKKKSSVLPFVIVFLVLLLIATGVAGFFGFQLYSQAKDVKAQAKEVVALVETVPDAILSGDTATLTSASSQVVTLADEMNTTMHGDLWNIAAKLPVVGSDITSAQTLGDTLVDLANNALEPLAENLEGFNLKGLFENKRVNIEKLSQLANAVSEVIPVINRAASTVELLPKANIEQVAEYIEKVETPLSEVSAILTESEELLPLLPQVFGSEGTRTYFVMAEKTGELRSLGGMPGAVGFVTITDGYIEVGDFGSVNKQMEHVLDHYVYGTEEEMYFYYGDEFYKRMNELTDLAEYERVGQLATEYCSQYWPSVKVDGVVTVTPFFLQCLMYLTGSSVQVEGVTMDGTNASEVLANTAYLIWDDDSEVSTKSDEFFSEAADLAVDAIFDNFGNFSLTKMKDLLTGETAKGHFYLWMADETEQQAVRKFDFSGNLDYDVAEPMFGVYFIDYTYSAVDWYLSATTTVDRGYTNSKGGTTYNVTTVVTNNLTNELVETLPQYVWGYNSGKLTDADIITRIYLMAPYGGTITDVQMSYSGEGEDIYTADELMHDYDVDKTREVWGHEGHKLQFHTLAQSSVTITYKINTQPGDEQPITVRQTPMSDVNKGNVILAWEQ